MSRGEDFGTPGSATATHATAAVATVSGIAGKKFYVTDFSGSSDKAGALILVKDGSTTIWQDRMSNASPIPYQLKTPLNGSVGADVSVTVDGTAMCNANLSGYFI